MTILPARDASSCLAQPLVPRIYVNGQRRRDLVALHWTALPAPAFGCGEIAVAPQGLWSTLSPFLPAVGSKVQIICSTLNGAMFDGIVAAHKIRLDDSGEQAVAVIEHIAAIRLQPTLLGRHHLVEDRIVHRPLAPLAFNRDATTQCSLALHALRRPCCLFDASPDSQPWSVGEALAYLFAREETNPLHAPSRDELLQLAGEIELAPITLTGDTLSEAIEKLAAQASLSIAAESATLRLYRPGRDGRRAHIELQSPGETFDPRQTNLATVTLEIPARPSRAAVHVLGAAKRYQSTFYLSPAWEHDSQLIYSDTVRSRSDDWTARRDLLRYWVLNENGAFESLDKFDFATVHEDFTLHRTRRFDPPLFAPDAASSPSLIVEYREDSTCDWMPYPASVVACRERCAIRLDDDELPADYFQAAANGLAELRVTAAVESDVPLSASLPGDRNIPPRILHRQNDARYDEILDSSAHHTAGIVRDDSDLLRQVALAESDHSTPPGRATISLATINPTLRVGDLISRIAGRRISLASRPDRAPSLIRIHHDFSQQQTILEAQG